MKFKTYTKQEIEDFLDDHGIEDISKECWEILQNEPCNMTFNDLEGILTIKIKFIEGEE